MSAPNVNGAAAKGPPKGDDKKDDTIVKITGVAIATGIAYSVYKSVVGRKQEEPFGTSHNTKAEPFHEQISIDKPEGLSKFEAGLKGKTGELKDKAGEFTAGAKEKVGEFKAGVQGKAGEIKAGAKDKAGEFKAGVKDKGDEFKAGAKDFKGSVADKGREVKSAAEGQGEEVKEAVEEGREKAAVQEKETKQQWGGWFSWLGGQANKEKDEAAAKAEKAKEETLETIEEGEETVEGKGKNFFDQADEKLSRGKDEVGRGFAAAEANVEKAGAAVANKAHQLTHGKPFGGKSKRGGGYKEYGIVSGDTLWSISRRYGVTIDELKSANGIWNEDYIVAGDTLSIPK